MGMHSGKFPKNRKVPPGTLLIVCRHGETNWNHKKNFARYNGLPTPARTDDDCDSALSAPGRVQAVLTGWWLKKAHHCFTDRKTLDCVLLSTSRRSSETWHYIRRLWHGHRNFHLEQLSDISEIKHQSAGSQSQDSITLQDIADEAHNLFLHLPPAERRKKMHEYLISEMINRGAGEQAIDHALEKRGTDILKQRKHPDGESYLEKRDKVDHLFKYFESLIEGRENTSTLMCTHGRTYIAILQQLEGFSDDQARMMQKAEGPPFPPHVSVSFFQEQDGHLVHRGEQFHLAPCLKVDRGHPRLLDFRATPGLTIEKFSIMCEVANVTLNSRLAIIPRRNAKGIFTDIDYNHRAEWPPRAMYTPEQEITATDLDVQALDGNRHAS
ncbi:hypothetical protein GF391_02910 [Candidatus Uhrbacteria bacterium]|nr:hypothetical protein [Candidatus Uhrbacteria bacterium]